MEALFGLIFLIVLFGILFIYDTLSWGLVLYKFWAWFVLPIFTTLPEISFVQAIGLMFFIGLFKSHFMGENLKDEYKKDTNITIFTAIILPWMTYFFGWLAWQIWLV
jgi:hypothetical protein